MTDMIVLSQKLNTLLHGERFKSLLHWSFPIVSNIFLLLGSTQEYSSLIFSQLLASHSQLAVLRARQSAAVPIFGLSVVFLQ